jgi:hypothetical protein
MPRQGAFARAEAAPHTPAARPGAELAQRQGRRLPAAASHRTGRAGPGPIGRAHRPRRLHAGHHLVQRLGGAPHKPRRQRGLGLGREEHGHDLWHQPLHRGGALRGRDDAGVCAADGGWGRGCGRPMRRRTGRQTTGRDGAEHRSCRSTADVPTFKQAARLHVKPHDDVGAAAQRVLHLWGGGGARRGGWGAYQRRFVEGSDGHQAQQVSCRTAGGRIHMLASPQCPAARSPRLRPRDALVLAVHHRVLQQLPAGYPALELLLGHEPVVDAVRLAGARGPGGGARAARARRGAGAVCRLAPPTTPTGAPHSYAAAAFAAKPQAFRERGPKKKRSAPRLDVAVTTKWRSGRCRRSSASTESLPTPLEPLTTTTCGLGGGACAAAAAAAAPRWFAVQWVGCAPRAAPQVASSIEEV